MSRCTHFDRRLFLSGLAFLVAFALAPQRSLAADAASVGIVPRTVENFNRGWKFSKGDTADAKSPSFDDAKWQAVRLPHDWAIAGPHDPDEWGHTGKLPWRGVGWYRKTFTLPKSDAGKQVYLDFDGVMAFPQVYVNGKLAGEWDYGYTSFRVDATPFIKFGEPNTVAVRVDTRNHGSRWYPGAGIYRKVTLVVANPVHIAHWGTHVSLLELKNDSAFINVDTTIENDTSDAVPFELEFEIDDPNGKRIVTEKSKTDSIAAGQGYNYQPTIEIKKPQLWDVDSPNLYTLTTTVMVDGKALDRTTTPFGIRTFEFTADDGFHLNGRRVQLKGVCLHHDQGPLGAAFFPRAMERQLEIMREMGVNAIRTSHNAPAPELLDLCDRMGFVVWDECFDKWDDKASRVNGEPPLMEHGERHLSSMVKRDRNHPSVVVWSIANEISDMGGEHGLTNERCAKMRDIVRKYDSRPVGLAHHIPSTGGGDTFEPLDVTGWNYARRYEIMKKTHPEKPILYTESASALSTRGFYELPLVKSRTDFSPEHQVDSYDLNCARWSDIADVEFDLMERDKFVAGEFVWTGFDYLGEPTPFDRQAASSYFGIVDTCGLPKDRFYLYRSYWRPDTPTVHILPHWNWEGREGENVPVFVYTNGDSAELFLNGKSLGKREKTKSYSPPENIAIGKPTTASSVATRRGREMSPDLANDGNKDNSWTAASGAKGEWWQIDLGGVEPVADVVLMTHGQPGNFLYKIDVSDDGNNWRTVVNHDKWHEGWGDQFTHGINTDARFIRIEFTDLRNDARAALREVSVYPQSYYEVTNKYRLRWNDVAYEPGELKAVAYKDGKQVGEAVMRTAGKPAQIRLTPDRSDLDASGDDLCYIVVEALDADGNLCPLADDKITFAIDGPATIAGVGNGNPLSLEDYQADHRKLFYGKALLVVRADEGEGGKVTITATGDGLKPATTTIESAAK